MSCQHRGSISHRVQKINGRKSNVLSSVCVRRCSDRTSTKYVAIHQGKVVDSGVDEITLGLRIYAKFGSVPIYVGHVSNEPQRVARIPSPRLQPANE